MCAAGTRLYFTLDQLTVLHFDATQEAPKKARVADYEDSRVRDRFEPFAESLGPVVGSHRVEISFARGGPLICLLDFGEIAGRKPSFQVVERATFLAILAADFIALDHYPSLRVQGCHKYWRAGTLENDLRRLQGALHRRGHDGIELKASLFDVFLQGLSLQLARLSQIWIKKSPALSFLARSYQYIVLGLVR
eukprot:CAMPEP_0172639064 /NCGR_PEP_ID=MMETSP1068-20121228/216819_1 /TAXON_ID=35684 /ORGANISM="Pseudopedinella elastica, Strain CCMP716" /LENGTH=192 /DNA_ID=CAMNT_0013452103 /DNA_START=145 /DNA_END=719 /DNA_ORIENTATION=-